MFSNSKVLIVHISFTALINNEGIGGIRKVPRRIKCTFWTSGALLVICGNHKCTPNFWGIVVRGQRFCIGIIHHEVRRIPRWVPSLDYGKCFTYRGLIFGLTYEFSHNLVSHVGMYTNEKKWNCLPCRFVRGVHQGQFTTISFKHSLLPWLLMYKEEGFLRSSRSWFIFFVSLPIFFFFTQCFLVVIAILHC